MENNIELIPDKDGFLFEIEDKVYLVTQVYIIVFFSALFLLLFYLADFSLTNLYEHGRLGRLVIVFSIPIYLYYIIKTLYYVLIQKRKKIKFYETNILLSNSVLIVLNDTKKMYKLKISLISQKKESLSVLNKLFAVLVFPFVAMVLLSAICSIYLSYRKLYLDNLLFITNKNEKIGGVAYNLLNQKEQIKVKLYFEKYLNINIDELEQRLVLIPNE
ncbi:hypothetical protein [Halarcobacter bivalviorum]|uniref:Membrane protein n=1 Tax=Halarcobacter bivalviorum TaxID=663364 RepID=A0AAX2AAM6_9BACT|nr:hypothetical protein [Halarcobacter bivalviorum]AXH12591.1 putative membrane protein [Halarcobacter bivalviorum]RXK10484.1 hypothetical protein CRV05_04190 [Halarcobacter bivalviorum]